MDVLVRVAAIGLNSASNGSSVKSKKTDFATYRGQTIKPDPYSSKTQRAVRP